MVYQREITVKLILLRTFFFAAFGGCIYSFRTRYDEYGYVLAVVLLSGLFIHLTQFRVSGQGIEVIKYYCYGWIPVKWIFHKNEIISVLPYEVELSPDADGSPADGDDGAWGCLLFFIPAPKAEVKRLVITYRHSNGAEKKFRVTLTAEELDLIRSNP